MVRTVVFSIWASAKVQPFNNPVEQNTLESVKLTDDTTNGKVEVVSGN